MLLAVHEPPRGGKEAALREMPARGHAYDRKSTWAQFVAAMTEHTNNGLLMLQVLSVILTPPMDWIYLDLASQLICTVPQAVVLLPVVLVN